MNPTVSLVTEVEVAAEVAATTEVVAVVGETTEETGLMDRR